MNLFELIVAQPLPAITLGIAPALLAPSYTSNCINASNCLAITLTLVIT